MHATDASAICSWNCLIHTCDKSLNMSRHTTDVQIATNFSNAQNEWNQLSVAMRKTRLIQAMAYFYQENACCNQWWISFFASFNFYDELTKKHFLSDKKLSQVKYSRYIRQIPIKKIFKNKRRFTIEWISDRTKSIWILTIIFLHSEVK